MTANQPVRLLSATDLQALGLSIPEALALIEQAYRLDAEGKVEVPTKLGVHPDYPGSFLHAMPAWVDGARALGMKWISYFPGNFDRGLADSTGLITLNDPGHGHPVCIMEGMYVTFLRTVSCAAIAARHLLRTPPETMTLVGCGGLGSWSLRIFAAAFPSLREVRVASRRAPSREDFCRRMAAEVDCALTPVEDVSAAIATSDIVISSLPSGDVRPVGAGVMRPGTVFIPLDVTHSWEPGVLSGAGVVVSDNPGHFASQIAGLFPDLEHRPITRLQDLVAGKATVDTADGPSFVVVAGIASTDVTIGWELYRRAVRDGRGTEFRFA